MIEAMLILHPLNSHIFKKAFDLAGITRLAQTFHKVVAREDQVNAYCKRWRISAREMLRAIPHSPKLCLDRSFLCSLACLLWNGL